MVKVKNKKNAALADTVRNKRRAEATKKVLNPFEVHVNREKFKVLGRKLKHDRGLPGVSRAKAMKKRKETLGTEMKLMHKDNTFMDRRIGETNNSLSSEDKILARFAAERARHHSKKSIFNLADDVLTHRGQTLEEVEKFDDPRSSDDEDDDGRKFSGGLGNEFVAEGHFGGGMLSKTDNKDGAKSHKDLIEQLIADSKKRKAEKQKQKEQTLDLTEKLDTDWKDLQPIAFKKKRTDEGEESLIDKLLSKEGKRSDDYDKMMRELRFEKRGTPSDGLKSEEKLAKEAKEKLEQLEKERQQRMHGIVKSNISSAASNKHRSADDLDDNFEMDNEPMYMVAYDKDGKPLLPEHILQENSLRKKKVTFDNEDSASENDDAEANNDDDDDDESSEEEADSLNDLKESEKSDESASEDNDDEQEVKSEEKHSVNKENNKDSKKEENKKNCTEKKGSSDDSGSESENDDSTTLNIDQKSKNNLIDSTKHELKAKFITYDKVLIISDVASQINKNKKCIEKDKISESNESTSKEDIPPIKHVNGVKRKNSELNEAPFKLPKRTEIMDENLTEVDTEQLSKVPAVYLKPINDLVEEKSTAHEKKEIFDSSVVDEQIANQIKADLLARKVIMEKAQKELPYTYEMPEEYEQLEEMLSKHQPEYQAVIIERLVKCYHPSLADGNKGLLSKLFAYLLQYLNDVFSGLKKEKQVIKSFQIFDKIAPQIYDLAQINVMNTKHCLSEVIQEKYEDYKKNRKTVPDLDTLIFFKLVSLIFPTSDFRHPVVTPCLVFMTEILTECKYRDSYSISRGLFLTALILEYTVLSKRFVPSAINFIRGIIFLSANTSILNPIQICPPFKLFSKESRLLVLEDDCKKMAIENKMAAKDLVSTEVDSEFKIRCFSTSVNMLKEMFTNCNHLETQECMFEPHIQLLSRVDLDLYPEVVRKNVRETLSYMKETLEMKTYTHLTREKKRPKALKLFEPDVQEVFTGSRNSKMSRELADRQKIQHKLKRETKGALREIRRDKAYVGALKIKQKIHSDNIRKEKVKQIYKDASIQQSELNTLKRQK